MKLAILGLAFLVAAAQTNYTDHPRGCIYDDSGHCMRECEEGTHSYGSGCGPVMSEPTCEQPTPKVESGNTCDFSACYCDAPTVRHKASKKCVKLKDCYKVE
ncbi:uncharacterized protein LOC105394953 [Plutella xylostella]|uniref:uncharacterized protein LOC105394953 n=1 Tax=Plutella xylostella TaxID=51655 RepID=UPI002032445E|nr:uncharacterized protein LOC105394953 [Plutella xylostella]